MHTYLLPLHSPTPSRPNWSLSTSAIIKFSHNRHAYYINGPINFQYSKLTRLICAENGQTEAIHSKGPRECCLLRSARAPACARWHISLAFPPPHYTITYQASPQRLLLEVSQCCPFLRNGRWTTSRVA